MAPTRREIQRSDITPDMLINALEVYTIDGTRRVKCVHCRHYRHYAERTTRHRSHLLTCQGFLASLPDEFWHRQTDPPPPPPPSQVTLTTPNFAEDSTSHAELDRLLGMAIFNGVARLSTFASDEMSSLVNALNPEYCIPEASKIVDSILPSCYNTVQDEVFEDLSTSKYLNISLDERTDLRNRRIMNIFVTGRNRSYFLALRNLEGVLNAEKLADWIISELRDLTKNDFSRINSITTTTSSSKMHSLGAILRAREEIKDTFLFGCDSQGLQLLTEDILSLPNINKTIKKFKIAMKHFYGAPLQLETLRKIQLREVGEERALLGSLTTHPRSYYLMLLRFKNNEGALIQYVRENTCDDELRGVLRSMDFWDEIDQLVRVLKPIHEHIKACDAVSAHAGYVVQRWLDSLRHLDTFRGSTSIGHDIASYLDSKFHDRMNRQVQDLHWTTHYLNPTTVHESMSVPQQQQIFDVIRRYCKNPQEAVLQFAHYRIAAGEFSQSCSWGSVNQREMFWLIQSSMRGSSSELANFAQRLFHTTTTSTPSERAFSELNHRLTLLRNGMTVAQADMATFIYLNNKVLQEISVNEGEDEQLVHEDDLMLQERDKVNRLAHEARLQALDEAASEEETALVRFA